MRRVFERLGRAAAAGCLLAGIGLAGGCADYPTRMRAPRTDFWPGLPPTLIVRNESASPVRVFPWIGRIDTFDASGASGFMRKGTFDVEAGCTRRISLGSGTWSTAAQDGIVRIGVLELDEHGRAPADHEALTEWFEFEQPHPYDLRIGGDPGALEFESLGDGALIGLSAPVGEG